MRPGGALDPRVVTTTEDGRFDVGALASGTWRFESSRVGYLPLRVDLDLRHASRIELRLVPQPADYQLSPLELMPEEQPLPPPDLTS